jgi:hypothetical protein
MGQQLADQRGMKAGAAQHSAARGVSRKSHVDRSVPGQELRWCLRPLRPVASRRPYVEPLGKLAAYAALAPTEVDSLEAIVVPQLRPER